MNQTIAEKERGVYRLVSAMLVPALFLGGCESGAAGGSAAPSPSPPVTASTSTHAEAAGSAPKISRATPAAALTGMLRQIAGGDSGPVCREMARLAAETKSAPSPYPTGECVSTFTSLHTNFVDDGLTAKSSFTVGLVKSSGDSATVSGTNIHVKGTTLTALMIAHSTGVKPGQFDITFQMTRIGGAWHVTGTDMTLG